MTNIRVFYDGGCPLCQKEISIYQRADQARRIDWCNVNDPGHSDLPLPRDTLLARFHVQRADGQLVSGARGFIEVWQQLPGWRWLAKFAVIPGVPGIMEGMYRAFLKIRPGLQRWVRKVSG